LLLKYLGGVKETVREHARARDGGGRLRHADAGSTFDEAALRARCAHAMAKYKVPARIFALDELPVTVGLNGVKNQRGKLREIAQERLRQD
jgi:acyl-CoA synthetase (AMP-forming)/AMP-acid ligase II